MTTAVLTETTTTTEAVDTTAQMELKARITLAKKRVDRARAAQDAVAALIEENVLNGLLDEFAGAV